jgi:hypothetical protein
MTALHWDGVGEKRWETGVDHCALYQLDGSGDYVNGVAWNGITAINETPSGAESNKTYADNIVYANMLSKEEFGCTIEAYTSPLEFEQNDGSAVPTPGVMFSQQRRKTFGLAWRTRIGNDVEGDDLGYKLHLAYGCLAAPSEKPHATVNESPEATQFSWEVTTTPVPVGVVNGVEYRPMAKVTIDSTEVDPAKLALLETQLFGGVGVTPHLPLPQDVYAIVATTLTLATPTVPTYNSTTDLITIPNVTGVEYLIEDTVVPAGTFGPISANTVVEARPLTGYKFPVPFVPAWLITFV